METDAMKSSSGSPEQQGDSSLSSHEDYAYPTANSSTDEGERYIEADGGEGYIEADGFYCLAKVLKRQRDGKALESCITEHLDHFLVAEDNAHAVVLKINPFWPSTPEYLVPCPPVHIYPPSEILGRNFYTLVTVGLSGTFMEPPEEMILEDKWRRAEIMCYLPSSWNWLTEPWPITMLQNIAGYVIDTGIWISHGHGLPKLVKDEEQGWTFSQKNVYAESQVKQEADPFVPGSQLTHVVLFEQVFEQDQRFKYIDLIREEDSVEFQQEKINFLVVLPITSAEDRLKKNLGLEESIYKMIDKSGKDFRIIDPMRSCYVNDYLLPEY